MNGFDAAGKGRHTFRGGASRPPQHDVRSRKLRLETLEERTLLSADSLSVFAHDGVGLCDLDITKFYLKNANESGYADITLDYGPGDDQWIPIAGDWEGDGIDTIGLYNPRSSVFYLRYTNDSGYADLTFVYGQGRKGWLPIVGDWDGNGTDTIGLYNPTNSVFYLRNTNDSGYADLSFLYGRPGCGWTPIAGDWDGNAIDTIGLYNPTNSSFYLRNTNDRGVADNAFGYGRPGCGWTPITGNWLGILYDTIGLYNPAASSFFLRDDNSGGYADNVFYFGPAHRGWTPITGCWSRDDFDFLTASSVATNSTDASPLTEVALDPILEEAVARWAADGLDQNALERLCHVTVVVADLPGARLGMACDDLVVIDRDAAGHGWFVDPTPASDEEFITTTSSDDALDPQVVDRIDLLSVVQHELGHVAGLVDLDVLAESVMSRILGPGVRRHG